MCSGGRSGDKPASLVSGMVQLDARDLVRMRRQAGSAVARGVILHELGHLVGLGHVQDRRQNMYPEISTRNTAMGRATSPVSGCSAADPATPTSEPTRASRRQTSTGTGAKNRTTAAAMPSATASRNAGSSRRRASRGLER